MSSFKFQGLFPPAEQYTLQMLPCVLIKFDHKAVQQLPSKCSFLDSIGIDHRLAICVYFCIQL